MIQRLALKKQNNCLPFEQYMDGEEHFCLTLTGVGSVAAATAVGSVCGGRAGSGDFLCNVGVCAGAYPGRPFLIHKITEAATGRTFYPDQLYRCPFAECPAVTVPQPLEDPGPILADGDASQGLRLSMWQGEGITVQAESPVYDMEAAGFYQAAAHFAGPHHIACIKVVSDTGRGEKMTPDQLTHRIQGEADRIAEWLGQIRCMLEAEGEPLFSFEEEEMLQKLCGDMHCSETMRSAVRRQLIFAKLTGRNVLSSVGKLYKEGLLPCRDRREGKRCWNDIRRRFF